MCLFLYLFDFLVESCCAVQVGPELTAYSQLSFPSIKITSVCHLASLANVFKVTGLVEVS